MTGDGAGMADKEVRRRRVFYIPGYDPFHPRRYRELYRSESAGQAAISGYRIEVSARQGGEAYGWTVAAEIEGGSVQAEVEVLVWSDLVKRSMRQGIAATYLQLLRTVWVYLGSGAIFRLARLRKGPALAALYPIAVLLLQLGLAVLLGVATGMVLGALLPDGALPAALAWAAGLAVVWASLWQFRRLDGRLYAYYLMHDYAFTAQRRGAYPRELEERLREFSRRIGEALREDWDEVLVVGHSSGAHLAISALADLLRAEQAPVPGGAALALLTLGHVVPMVSFLPEARRLRADLAWLSARDELAWIDVTAPGDGCTYALCDPVGVTGVAPPDRKWPLILSAAFTLTLSPERWKTLRWRFFRLHFQYLCAFDRPGDYDYFRITAGPLTLAARYEGRPASKSRIETPLSGYRTTA